MVALLNLKGADKLVWEVHRELLNPISFSFSFCGGAMGRGKFKSKPTGHRNFSTPEELRKPINFPFLLNLFAKFLADHFILSSRIKYTFFDFLLFFFKLKFFCFLDQLPKIHYSFYFYLFFFWRGDLGHWILSSWLTESFLVIERLIISNLWLCCLITCWFRLNLMK